MLGSVKNTPKKLCFKRTQGMVFILRIDLDTWYTKCFKNCKLFNRDQF